ncbi:MAG: DUF971 domain-containing protein [Burkholderiales bacterium]|nr:DUF971 domain-containing protein [Burkholderiales bacterium]
MPGPEPAPQIPTDITLDRKERVLALTYAEPGGERRYDLSFEFLRVHSPSAEVRGHGRGQETLQVGKRGVDIVALEPVGMYALQPTFSDGHNSGIFAWPYLRELCEQHDALWRDYLARLEQAGASRD